MLTAFSVFVAGAGIEPAPGGYEPPEVPFLQPAISLIEGGQYHTVFCSIWQLIKSQIQ